MALPLPSVRRPPTTTPLTWAGGIVLLGASLWLPGIFAFFRAVRALVL